MQTDSLHFNIAKLMSKSPETSKLVSCINYWTTSAECLYRNSAFLVKWILAENPGV